MASITIDSILEDLQRSNANMAPSKLRDVLLSTQDEKKKKKQATWQPLISHVSASHDEEKQQTNITQEDVEKSLKQYIDKHYQNNKPFDTELHERAYYECLTFLKADEWISSFFGLAPRSSSATTQSGLLSAPHPESEENILLEKLDGLEIAINEAIALAEAHSSGTTTAQSEIKSDLL